MSPTSIRSASDTGRTRFLRARWPPRRPLPTPFEEAEAGRAGRRRSNAGEPTLPAYPSPACRGLVGVTTSFGGVVLACAYVAEGGLI